MGIHQPGKEDVSSGTNNVGKKYVRCHIPRQKSSHLGNRKDTCHRCDWSSQKTKVDLGRARQQDTR